MIFYNRHEIVNISRMKVDSRHLIHHLDKILVGAEITLPTIMLRILIFFFSNVLTFSDLLYFSNEFELLVIGPS